MILVLDIEYDKGTKHYYGTVMRRVIDGVTTEVGRWNMGDPQIDWSLMKLAVTWLKRQADDDGTVYQGNSIGGFLRDVPGWELGEDGQLVRV